MNQIFTLDLRAFVAHAIHDVFETMLSMEIEPVESENRVVLEGQRFVGSVSFAGEVMGNLNIHVNQHSGNLITGAMLRLGQDESVKQEDVEDVIGELTNMVGGDLKSRFCDFGLQCDLSIPSVTSGSDFRIESMNWMRYECMAFRFQSQFAVVEVYIKSAN